MIAALTSTAAAVQSTATPVPVHWYLIVSTILFLIGVVVVLTRRNLIYVLMGVELILNAVNINLVAFNRYMAPQEVVGQVFAIFVLAVAAAEAAVGLALIIAIYRTRDTINLEDADIMKG